MGGMNDISQIPQLERTIRKTVVSDFGSGNDARLVLIVHSDREPPDLDQASVKVP